MKKPAPDTQVPTRATDTGLAEDPRPGIDDEGRAGESKQPETSTLRLLHVEDNPADAMLMQEYIRDLLPGTAFDTAARLSEVTLERVQTADCALLDLSLPDASGLDALLAVRKMSESLPIIVLTGDDDMELGLTAVRDGADDYLFKKHVDPHTLERAVQYAIGRRGLILQVAKAKAETIVASMTAEAVTSPAHRLVDVDAVGDAPIAPAQAEPGVQAAVTQPERDADEFALSGKDITSTPTPREAVVSAQALQTSELLTPAEVSTFLHVDPKTVSRWASDGKIASLRTLGGHRRFFKSEILALMPVENHSGNRPGPHPNDPASASPQSNSNRPVRGDRPGGEDSQLPERSGNTAVAAAGVHAAVATAREFEASSVDRAVTIAAEALVRAAQDAAVAGRTVR